ncbi:protease modulator HflC [Pseudomonas sp. 10B1]|uniref:protease modulator HflC n=1 Tax=unclassified Pseudomonas TaxID=196821 RepID=UPI002AB39F74|nr:MULTISPECIES: protease modulator HflC [unclassified Pseudomonas]MDY7558955.1 protease modulator HflC [Pseudomonas sp. AB6]MEA9979466.1 protease modulator HflC [Pseudomonas sp. RTS4]MEA9997155.1 protease modulator HflC [Pseudomonas sp. AA4]MEB0089407.1 protease modulator HflC [Pseudomonas sp. RTI1]MEB0124682.1 protease modulator HflC [Pseudomonas sp. CCC1.2]
MNSTLKWLLAGLGIVFVWTLGSSVYVVDETQQALVIRFGAPMGVAGAPGLKFKIPFSDSLVFYDSRLQMLTSPAEQVILGDQKRVEVVTYTRFRISDPLRFYQAVGTLDQANAQLTQMVSSSLRRELGQVSLRSLLSDERRPEVAIIQKDVAEKARGLGVDVTEVRLHRADLPFEASQAIYDRMKSERNREAKELRAQGFEWAQQIQGKADRDRTVLLSEVQRKSAITHGEADAEANQVLSAAFSKDPDFYKLYRSLQTYRQALADSQPMLVLTPDAEFLKQFRSGPATTPHKQ